MITDQVLHLPSNLVILTSAPVYLLRTMEKASKRELSPYLYSDIMIGSFFFTWVAYCSKFCINYLSQYPTLSNTDSSSSKRPGNKKLKPNEPRCEVDVQDGLSGQEIEIVMKELGFFSGSVKEEDRMDQWLPSTDLVAIFDEEGPNSEEVNHAFCVFDENKDGYIEAKELQRVLLRLGCHEGSILAACERMIAAYDKNKDGKIDFDEFQELLATSFG